MAFGVRLWDPRDLFDEDEKKPRRGSTAAYGKSRLYDVPIPPKARPKVTKEIKKRTQARKEQERQKPKALGVVPIPDVGVRLGLPFGVGPGVTIGARPILGDVQELASGAIPAAKTVGKMAKADIDKIWEQKGLRAPSKKTLDEYWELIKWSLPDEATEGKKQPKTQSELIGLLFGALHGWGRGFEKAVPNPFDSKDVAQAKKAWGEDPLFSALDLLPMASIAARPVSVARNAARIARMNEDMGLGRALAAGTKESYRPGSAARKGLAGGIEPRVLTSDMGVMQGRPWSRTPLMRGAQSLYDRAYEPSLRSPELPKGVEGPLEKPRPWGLAGPMRARAGQHRVGRAEERFGREQERQIQLDIDEQTKPIEKLVYGKLGRVAGAFGLKKNMTEKERRTATALMYRFQQQKGITHDEALRSVQADLEETLRTGKVEVPRGDGRRVKQQPLTAEEKRNLSVQITDIARARKDLSDGGIDVEEFEAGLDALKVIADRANNAGMDILERFDRLDPDALDQVMDTWTRRSQIIPRRLANRGHLPWKDLMASPERNAWMQIMENQFGPDQARAVIAATDAVARRMRPQNPASFYTDRVGMPTGETARQFVNRVGDDALFQLEQTHPDWVRNIVEGLEGTSTQIFYSPLQRWITSPQGWDKKFNGAKEVRKETLRNEVEKAIPAQEFYNTGLDIFFDQFPDGTRIAKEDFMEHLSSRLNAYNLEEHYFINEHGAGSPDLDIQARRSDTVMGNTSDTMWNHYNDSALLSRDPKPGEYREIVMRLPGPGRGKPYGRFSPSEMQSGMGKGFMHWGMEDVVVHMRFQVFEENGVRKLLIEEIQSDWSQEAKKFPHRDLSNDEIREVHLLQERMDSIQRRRNRLSHEQTDLDQRTQDVQWWIQERERRLSSMEIEDKQLRADGKTSDEAFDAEVAKLNDELNDLYDEKDDILEQEQANYSEGRKILDEWNRLDKEKTELGGAGTTPAALGDKYYRAAVRRLAREASDHKVDEIIFQDPLTQLVRAMPEPHKDLRAPGWWTADYPDTLEPVRGKDPSDVLDDLTEWESPWRQKEAQMREEIAKEIEASGPPPDGIDPKYLAKLGFSHHEIDIYFNVKGLKTWRSLYGEDGTFANALRKEYGLEKAVYRRDAYEGKMSHETGHRTEDGPMPGAVFQVSDPLHKKVADAQAIYQKSFNPNELPRGATELLQGRTLAHLFEKGGPDTWMHELGHIALHDLGGEDLTFLEKYYAGGKELAGWERTHHENFTRDWDAWIREGIAPTPELAGVFAKLSAWCKEIWEHAKQGKVVVDPKVAEVFDRMFAKVPEAGDEMETYGYFPHRDMHEIARQDFRGGVRPPAAGQVIGVPRKDAATLNNHQNNLIHYQTGQLNPDPGALVETLLRRHRFQMTLDAREDLWAKGHPLSGGHPPRGAWLVRNPHTPPERVSAKVQGAVRGQEMRRDVEAETEADSGLAIDPDEFRKEIIARAGENPPWASDMENVRWVPASYVNARFGDVFESKPRGRGASSLRLLTAAQRATGIYGRPLAYAAGNVPFNVMALMATQPFGNIRSAQRMVRIERSNPKLYRKLASGSGQTKAEAGLPGVSYVRPANRVQGAEVATTQFQRGMADLLSAGVDDPFRVTAMLTNARKRGYHTDKEIEDMIDADGADWADIKQLTREQMLDFDALNPFNRKMASNLLYLWPFMYAATKWPLMYAREYPLRAGAAAQLIEQEPDRMLPLEVANFWKSKGIDLTAINPVGPAGEIAGDLDKLAQDPTKLDLSVLKERLSPTIDLLVEGAGGGKEHALQNFARGTIPGISEAAAFAGEEWRGSKMYSDRDSPWPYLATRHGRFVPRELNEEKMQETIEQFKRDKVTTATIELDRTADKDKINKYMEAMGGVDYQEEVQKSFTAWWDYQEAVGEKKDSSGQRKLTPVQQVEILDDVVREHFPEYAEDLYPLDVVREAKDMSTVEQYVKELRGIVNEARTELFDDYRSYAAD